MTDNEAINMVDNAIKSDFIRKCNVGYDLAEALGIVVRIATNAIKNSKSVDTSGDLISREALKEILTIQKTDFLSKSDDTSIENDKLAYRLIAKGTELALNCVNIIPPVEPERPQGKWVVKRLHNGFEDVYCPYCNARPTRSEYGYYLKDNFCHECGADMKGGAE